MKIIGFCDRIIETSFLLLFFLTPLFLTPFNYELFEFNKMLLVYGLTIIIAGFWLIKMVCQRKIIFQLTPLDLAILLFLLSQIISTFVSIDRHVSLFGYYSRFNGGLISTISYIVLYYAFVSNIKFDKLIKFLKASLLSALVVSLYGIFEHFGIDKNLWVQDVQNRVFSTLGQPNWLGAYLAIMIPIGVGSLVNSKFEYRNSKQSLNSNDKNSKRLKHSDLENSNLFRASDFGFRIFAYYFLFSTFYLCLLYTKSRSGLIGFGIGFGVFFILTFFLKNLASQGSTLQNFFRPFLILSTLYFILSALVGTPWTPSIANFKFQISNFKFGRQTVMPPVPPTGPALETGGTESGEIRKIVWTGAIDIARHYPLFGTGPETFAFAYYQYRPIAHNLVSEWDFLYNKAHNEYLNYAATTGFVGLGTYLLMICTFLWTTIKFLRLDIRSLRLEKSLSSNVQLQNPASSFQRLISIGLLSGYISILITNFFGFSVVVVSLYFWLIPAFTVILSKSEGSRDFPPQRNPASAVTSPSAQNDKCRSKQIIFIILIIFITLYLLSFIFKLWLADFYFNRASTLAKSDRQQQAYELFHRAIDLSPGEPLFRDELSYTDAVLSVAAFDQPLAEKEATLSSRLLQEAILQNQKALTISPKNLNFWKTRTKVFYVLSTLDKKYLQTALLSILKAKELAPTDPKIAYNTALLYGQINDQKMAIKTLEEAIKLKANYADAHYALALFYKETGKKKEAINELQYILDNISPNDAQIKAKLEEWQN